MRESESGTWQSSPGLNVTVLLLVVTLDATDGFVMDHTKSRPGTHTSQLFEMPDPRGFLDVALFDPTPSIAAEDDTFGVVSMLRPQDVSM